MHILAKNTATEWCVGYLQRASNPHATRVTSWDDFIIIATGPMELCASLCNYLNGGSDKSWLAYIGPGLLVFK